MKTVIHHVPPAGKKLRHKRAMVWKILSLWSTTEAALPSVRCLVKRFTNLLYKLNASKQIHAKVNKLPHYPLSGVLFLLQNEHVVIKELLQFLVSEINAKLLETVILKKNCKLVA